MKIYLSNKSSVVSNSDYQKIIKSINVYLVGLCKDWELTPIQVFNSIQPLNGNTLPNTIFILDDTDDASALGYHYEEDGNAVGRVFAKTILNYGGVVLYKDPYTMTVAQCVCHEIFELIGNPVINKWFMDNSGILWAGELCDAVQGNIYLSNIPGNGRVGLSDYVLPNYFNADMRRGPFNKMNTLSRPFQIDDYGYAIKLENGDFVPVFGSKCPQSRVGDVNEDVSEMKMKFGF
jgi:hypothetical protein